MAPREADAAEAEASGPETLPRTFEASAARHADRPAQRYKGGVHDRSLVPEVVEPAEPGAFATLTYGEMRHVVRRLAVGFRELGVGAGDRVGILGRTRMEWAQCDLAVLAAGGVVTTLYPGSSAEEVAYRLGDAGATGVVVEDAEAVELVLDAVGGDVEFVVTMDRRPGGGPGGSAVHTLADVYALGEAAYDRAAYDRHVADGSPSDLASVLYTSGTTGRPKGVRLTHGNFTANGDQLLERLGPRAGRRSGPCIDEETRVVSFLPLAHVFERLVGHFVIFTAGGCVAYAESPATLTEDFGLVSPTAGTGVPRVYERLLAGFRRRAGGSRIDRRLFDWAVDVARAVATADDPGMGLRLRHRVADRLVYASVRAGLGGSVDFLISGGSRLPPEVCAVYHGMGLPVLEGYGLTETAPVVAVNPPEAPRIGTIGPPVVGLDVRLDDGSVPDGEFEDVDGEVGELLVRGPNVTDGYWERPGATEAAFTDNGFLRTGDLVARDPDGYLTFLARVKSLLVLSTGKNVAPTPIEEAVEASDLVDQCMVVGDDRRFVGALVVPDFDGLAGWADRTGVDLPDEPAAVCTDGRVRERVAEAVEVANAGLEPHETIERFRLVPEAFTVENDLLTPTLKKRRRAVLERHAAAVEAMYAADGGASG